MEKPNVTFDIAKELIFRLYGLEVLDIKEMVSYDDQNFHIQVSSNYNNPHIITLSQDGYTLKIQNPHKTATIGFIDSTHSVLNYVNEKEMKIPIPIVNVSGATWCQEELPIRCEAGGEINRRSKCGVHLLSYVPGKDLSTVKCTKDILQQCGQLLARFHNCLQGFKNDAVYNKHVWWSLPHLPELAEYMKDLDEEKTVLVQSVLDKYDEVQYDISKLPKGYIHGDFNHTNLLLNETSIGYAVNGILDFEHVHYDTYVYDIGTMLAYLSLGCDDKYLLENLSYALGGYLKIRTLTSEEMLFLKICIAGRLCQSLVMGNYNSKLDPTNKYILLSNKSGWSKLKCIWNTSDDIILEKWNNNCKI